MLKKNFGMILLLGAMTATSAHAAAVEMSTKDAMNSAYPVSGKLRSRSLQRKKIDAQIQSRAAQLKGLITLPATPAKTFISEKIIQPATAGTEKAALATNKFIYHPKFSLPTFGLEHIFQKNVFSKNAVTADLRTGPKAISSNGRKYFGPQIKAIQADYKVGAPKEFKIVSVQIGESNIKQEAVQATFEHIDGTDRTFLIMSNAQAKDIAANAKKASRLSKYSYAATTELNANVKVEAIETAPVVMVADAAATPALAPAPADAPVAADAATAAVKLTIGQKVQKAWNAVTSPFRSLGTKISNAWTATVAKYKSVKTSIGSFIDVNYQRASRLLAKVTFRSKKAEVAKADATTTDAATTATGTAVVAAATTDSIPAGTVAATTAGAPKEAAPAAPAAIEAPKGVIKKDAAGNSVPDTDFLQANFKNSWSELEKLTGSWDLNPLVRVITIGNSKETRKDLAYVDVTVDGVARKFLFGDATSTFSEDYKGLNKGDGSVPEPAGFLDQLNTEGPTWATWTKASDPTVQLHKLLNK